MELLFDKSCDTPERGQVVNRYFLIPNFDAEALLDKSNEINRPLGVDHTTQKRYIFGEGFAATKKKRLGEKIANFLLNLCRSQLNLSPLSANCEFKPVL